MRLCSRQTYNISYIIQLVFKHQTIIVEHYLGILAGISYKLLRYKLLRCVMRMIL